MATDRILICQTDGTCPRHGKYIYFCYECQQEWEEANDDD